jgi:hypothetical protein
MPSRTTEQIAKDNYCALLGHEWNVLKRGQGYVLRCTNKCSFDDSFILVPKSNIKPARFTLHNRFLPGERIVSPGSSGSYPDHSKNRWGHVVEIKEDIVTEVHETLVVQFDGEEPRGINPDVIAHGNDWRYKDKDPNNG